MFKKSYFHCIYTLNLFQLYCKTLLCTEEDGCEPNPCLNGAVCRGYRRSGYLCLCKEGYFGDRCQMCEWPSQKGRSP